MMIRRGQRHCIVIRPSIHPTVRLSFHSFITALSFYFRIFMYVNIIYAIMLFPYFVHEKCKTDRRHVIGHT